MAELPTGTVTFLFTDIEGSTKLLQRLGPTGYAEALATHQRLLRQAVADHAGAEVDTQGDSFFVAFPRATDALAAAVEATRALAAYPWPPAGMVRVRMGLHTGNPHLSKDGQRYVGIDVNRAARIAAAGHGGQILLSQATRDQVAKELVAGEGIRDLGKHRLKDLPRREELYQLVLSGLPADFPPLKTLDAWPGLRADLTVVVLISALLLAAAGLALPLVVPAFPRWIGWAAGGLAALLLVVDVVAKPVRRVLASQWRDARKPFAAITSTLLSLVVVTTTLFITKPPVFVKPPHVGYDFSYSYHAPPHQGGAMTVGLASAMISLAPAGISALQVQNDSYLGLWQSCLVQLPDLSLGLNRGGWQPDQCSEVPTVANGDESPDYKTTTLRIDPKAVWSDGTPLTADDFLFAFKLYADPNIVGVPMTVTALDEHTVQIAWPAPNVDYLSVLQQLPPLPLHAYATGMFAGVYDPKTDTYNSDLAQQLIADPGFTQMIPVDNGPFTVQSVVTKQVSPFGPTPIAVITNVTLVKNPHFFSNFFHRPALDQVTLESAWKDFGDVVTRKGWQDDMIAQYRQGGLEEVESLAPLNLQEVGGIPASEVITSPAEGWYEMGFNQRGVAPNAQANGGTSMFADKSVRQAFIEAFDRCSAARTLLGIKNCNDPNLFSDELTAPPAVDYDSTFHLPSYNPADAAALLDRAGYPVVNGVRRSKDGTTPLQLQLALSFSAQDIKDLAVQMTQDYAKNLHISVTVLDKVAQKVGQQGAFDMAIYGNAGSPDPIGRLLAEGGGWDVADIPTAQLPGGNIYGLVDPYVVARDQLGSQTQDADQRAAVYKQLQRYISGQFDIQPILLTSDVTLTKTSLCNFKKWPQEGSNLWNIADWYVAPSCPA